MSDLLAEPDGRHARLRALASLGLMFAATLAFYFPPSWKPGRIALAGADYSQLHERRMDFARRWLFTASPEVPAWYSRELMGTPFRANLQSFPWIPTRLVVLPLPKNLAYGFGVALAALLAALFTWLFCRRLGLSPLASALAGWTFPTAGFFSSRVSSGHLPLLEAYAALPLLLWLVERCIGRTGERFSRPLRLAWVSVATACIVLAGHPQLPAYALGAAVLYALYRAPGTLRWKILVAHLLGIGLAGFALVPMALLAQRSTRVLALDPPYNDVSFPVWRLWSFLNPWANGGPWSTGPHQFPAPACVFYDSVCYMGLVPVAALLFLTGRCIVRGRLPQRPWLFFLLLGAVALLTALPQVHRFLSIIPGTYLRSPARQLYLTTFCLSLGAGVALHVCLRAISATGRWWGLLLLLPILAGNGIDVFSQYRYFAHTTEIPVPDSAQADLVRAAGQARVAIDFKLPLAINRELDDAGFFDSLMLARSYRTMLSLAGLPPTSNIQEFDAGTLSPRALAYLGVADVITSTTRDELPLAGWCDGSPVYHVPHPSARAAFYTDQDVVKMTPSRIQACLRDPAQPIGRICMLSSTTPDTASLPGGGWPIACRWRRAGPDAIIADVDAPEAGVLRVLETADEGWRVEVDGLEAPLLIADDTFLAVHLPSGEHVVRFHYRTPGAGAGAGISLASLAVILLLVTRQKKGPLGTEPTPGIRPDQPGNN